MRLFFEIFFEKIGSKNIRVQKKFGSKKCFSFCERIFKVWLKLDWYPLIYSIEFKLGQMLHGQMLHRHMLTGQMFPMQLTTHTDGLIEFG